MKKVPDQRDLKRAKVDGNVKRGIEMFSNFINIQRQCRRLHELMSGKVLVDLMASKEASFGRDIPFDQQVAQRSLQHSSWLLREKHKESNSHLKYSINEILHVDDRCGSDATDGAETLREKVEEERKKKEEGVRGIGGEKICEDELVGEIKNCCDSTTDAPVTQAHVDNIKKKEEEEDDVVVNVDEYNKNDDDDDDDDEDDDDVDDDEDDDDDDEDDDDADERDEGDEDDDIEVDAVNNDVDE